MSDLLDQSPLIELAERLVEAARRAGADAADAVAVRSMSLSVEVRDGAVEESERAEGDDMGLRVLVGRRQAVVSTNDVKGNGADALAERAVAMARVAPEDQFAGLADETLLARKFPDLDLVDPALPDVGALEARARAAEAGCARRKGRRASRAAPAPPPASAEWCWSPATDFAAPTSARAIRCPWWRSPAKAPAWSATTIIRPRCMPPISKRRRRSASIAGERAVKRLNPRKVETRRVPVVFDPRVANTLVGSSRVRDQRRIDRAQDELPEGPHGREAVPLRHPHRRRSACASAACARIRSTAKASPARRSLSSRTACSSPGSSTRRPRASCR